MNVLCILVDSLNRHHLEPYGATETRTPNLASFARRAMTFDGHFIGCAPCMPARRNLLAGRREFLHRGWGPVEPYDRHLATEVATRGAVTGIVTDHFHYWSPRGNGYMQGFNSITTIRGQETDRWRSDPLDDLPAWGERIARWRDPREVMQYARNVAGFEREDHYFSPRVMSTGCDWLDRNHRHDQWLLWLESFDVHEPFLVPEPYRSLYCNPDDAVTCWPPYNKAEAYGHHPAFWNEVTERELAFIRGQYMGKVTMLDHWFGRVLEALDRLRLWDDTIVIVTTDHGHELGEKRRFGKSYPHYDLNAHIPLMVWHPALAGRGGRRVAGFTQTVDVHATIVQAMGADPSTCSPHGRSFLPVLEDRPWQGRDCVVYGTFGTGAVVTDAKSTFATAVSADAPIHRYSCHLATSRSDVSSGCYVPGIDCALWREPFRREVRHPDHPAMLFDRVGDPDQNENLIDSDKSAAARMKALLERELKVLDCPQEQYARMGLK
ncbi:MAG: sulfatase [Phycisphaeraceae bacterium]|nr:sulfatase [Phycisphaeraceae bacterium]